MRRTLDEVTELARTKNPVASSGLLKERASAQLQLGSHAASRDVFASEARCGTFGQGYLGVPPDFPVVAFKRRTPPARSSNALGSSTNRKRCGKPCSDSM
jgi:hypothetical protein